MDYKKRNVRWAVDFDCKRVRVLVVYKSENVLLKDFTIKRSGFWTVTMTYSNRVHVDGLTIRNNIGGYGPSSDGINTDSSRDILVENCDIDCNDDVAGERVTFLLLRGGRGISKVKADRLSIFKCLNVEFFFLHTFLRVRYQSF